MYVGVDVGGTFTDLVAYDDITHETRIVKTLTSRQPQRAIIEVLTKYRDSTRPISLIVHATTVGTNALLTRDGLARTALITNKGFKDILEIGRQRRPELYDLNTERPAPLVERKARFTIRGRTRADGSEIEQLDEKEISRVARQILNSSFDAIAVSLLNSYANPGHERRVRDLLLRAGFKGQIDLSSETDPAYREYERTSTTVVNSTLSQPVSQYLLKLEEDVRGIGLSCPVYVMNSDGTMSTIVYASRHSVSIIESGPAAGVLAASALCARLGLKNAITLDMGGTTAKAGAIINRKPELAYEFEAADRTYHGRSIKGSGYPVRQPFIDLAEVSAGGGTIAWADETQSLKVGPMSAGSDPGPAAYGKGGKKPTVTDANIVTGRLSPHQLLGGHLKLNYELASRAVRRLRHKLGESVVTTAENIIRLVNHNMSKALRLVTLERGRDPREFPLVVFGGAGPLHACDLAEALDVRQIIIPEHPGLFSAFGLLTAELSRTFSEPILKPVTADIESHFERVRNLADKSLSQEGFTVDRLIEQVDLRYEGQAYEIAIPYRRNSNLTRDLGRAHKRLYGYSSNDPVEAVNARVRAVISTPKPRLIKMQLKRKGPLSESSVRKVLLSGRWERMPVYRREALPAGAHGKGPCIIEEYDSTTLIGKRWAWRVDQYGSVDVTTQTKI